MKKKLGLLVAIFFSCVINAQDIHFSQYYESPLTLNPAMTGLFDGAHRFYLNYKNQWKSIATEPYTTYAFSYDGAYFKKNREKNMRKQNSGHLGIGANMFTDKAGSLGMGITQASLNIAYHVSINKNNVLSAGIYPSFAQNSISNTNMEWDNQWNSSKGFDPSLSSNEADLNNSFTYLDVGAGMMWTYSSIESAIASNDEVVFNVGGAYFHANSPYLSYYAESKERLAPKIVIHSRLFWGIKYTRNAVIPSFAFFKQGPSQEILTGLMYRYRLRDKSVYTGFISEAAISLGAYYRIGDAVIAATQFELKDIVFGFSYDINTSDLSPVSNGRGGLEVFLKYIIPSNSYLDRSMY